MSIGQALIAARESAGISVEQVAAATRIRQTLVRAIEHDDYRLCGGDFYARGHIRNITSVLRIDPAPLLAQFDAEHAKGPRPRPTEIYESDAANHPESRGPNWTAAMAAVLVLVVVYAIAQALTRGSGGG